MFQTNCLCTTVPRCTKYIQVSQHPRHLSVAGLFVPARVSVSVCAERVVVRNLASFAGLAMFSISLFCHIPIIPILFRLFRLQKSPCAFASIQGLYMLALTVALSVFLYQLGRRQTMKQLEAQWNSASRNFQNLPDNFKTVGNSWELCAQTVYFGNFCST